MIYIHVPFCRSFCTYCDFYSELCGAGEDSIQAYERGIISEIESRREEILSTRECNTLYIGGGTPSVLPLSVLERIVRALPLSDFTEFTVEVNPDDILRLGPDYVRGLLSLGVNRISMGVQSLDNDMLRWMNRRHNASAAVEAVRILRSEGVRNLSLDVIFGISHLSANTLSDTLRGILELEPEHISAYQLSIEEGSALARMVDDGKYTEASEEQCSSQYDLICATLAGAGYNHYEISNWARPGFEARHNSAYWSRAPYVGLGPAAHSLTLAGGSAASDGGSTPVTPPVSLTLVPSSSHVGGPDAPDLDSTSATPPGSLPLVPSSHVGGPGAPDLDSTSATPPVSLPLVPSSHAGGPGAPDLDSTSATPPGSLPLAGGSAQVRSWNSQEIDGWTREHETLTPEEIREEEIMLGLRTSRGIPWNGPLPPGFILLPSASSCSQPIPAVTPATLEDGTPVQSRIRIPEENWFIADALISSLL